jgi:hypothetical protein
LILDVPIYNIQKWKGEKSLDHLKKAKTRTNKQHMKLLRHPKQVAKARKIPEVAGSLLAMELGVLGSLKRDLRQLPMLNFQ